MPSSGFRQVHSDGGGHTGRHIRHRRGVIYGVVSGGAMISAGIPIVSIGIGSTRRMSRVLIPATSSGHLQTPVTTIRLIIR